MLRTAFLLNLFAHIEGALFITFRIDNHVVTPVGLFFEDFGT